MIMSNTKVCLLCSKKKKMEEFKVGDSVCKRCLVKTSDAILKRRGEKK